MTRKYKKRIENKEAGVHVGKTNCPKCGSSDNLAVYKHDDESYSATCFGGNCEFTAPSWDYDGNQSLSSYREKTPEELAYEKKQREIEEKYLSSLPSFEEVRDDFVSDRLKDRKITEEVMEFYGVKTDINDKGEVYREFYPTYREKSDKLFHVGYKIRSEFTKDDPEVKKKPELLGVRKNFKGTLGDAKKGLALFGQQCFSSSNHKRIFITEGQIDAMTGNYITRLTSPVKEGYAFVSVQGGSGDIQSLKDNLEYISSFKEIYLCFDKDDSGDKLLQKALKVLPVSKIKIMGFPDKAKDLNENWQKGMSEGKRNKLAKSVYTSIWEAKKYCPSDIKNLDEDWEDYVNRDDGDLILFPEAFGDLNEKTYGGFPLCKIINVIAPTSCGKTTFMKEMTNTILEKSPHNIGVLSLEETYKEYLEGMLSLRMNKHLNRIHKDDRDWASEKEALNELQNIGFEEGGEVQKKRIKFIDHKGGIRTEETFWDKMKFLTSGLDCKVIIVDPVQLLLSMTKMEDDDFASELATFVNTERVTVICVHHIVKQSSGGNANSEGGEITEEMCKGSGSLIQTAHMNMILSRNKVHDNNLIKNTIKIKISKCRWIGSATGIAGYSLYDDETGRLGYGMSPQEILEDQSDEEEFEMEDDKAINSFN